MNSLDLKSTEIFLKKKHGLEIDSKVQMKNEKITLNCKSTQAVQNLDKSLENFLDKNFIVETIFKDNNNCKIIIKTKKMRHLDLNKCHCFSFLMLIIMLILNYVSS